MTAPTYCLLHKDNLTVNTAASTPACKVYRSFYALRVYAEDYWTKYMYVNSQTSLHYQNIVA